MTQRSMVRVVLATVAAALALAPTSVLAQPPGGAGHAAGGRVGAAHHRGAHGPSTERPFFHRPFGGGVVFASPFSYGPPISYGYGPALSYAGPPAYDVMYGPPTGGTVTLTPPQPTVVQYPTGRYELRGDGLMTPYRWVWIPNPPPAPPPPPPPTVEPAPPAPPAAIRPEPPGNTRVYRWTDTQGVVHLTDRLETIPERYRGQAKGRRPS